MHIKGFLTAVAFVFVSASASQSMTLPAHLVVTAQTAAGLEQVSFRGRAFPYRYNWSRARACTRFEPVETSRGTRMQRVWVCSGRHH
jgi:hypothetical protein